MARGGYLRGAVSWLSIPTRENPRACPFAADADSSRPSHCFRTLQVMRRLLLVLSACASCLMNGCGQEDHRTPTQPLAPYAGEQSRTVVLPASAAKPSSCAGNIRLSGVVQSRDRSYGIALVSLDGGSAMPLQKGQDVEPGATIASISRDAVLLDCGGGTMLEVALQEAAVGPSGTSMQAVFRQAAVAAPVVPARSAAQPELIEMAHRELEALPSD